MRFTERITVVTLSCDRCDKRIPDNDPAQRDWMAATVNMIGDDFTVEHHFCPACRTALGDWLGGEPAPSGEPGPIREAGATMMWQPTTDLFRARVLRELTDEEKDPEVGPMFEIAVQAFGDELTPEHVRVVRDGDCRPCAEGEHGTIENGVCECCRDLVDEDAFEAYRAERKRLGL